MFSFKSQWLPSARSCTFFMAGPLRGSKQATEKGRKGLAAAEAITEEEVNIYTWKPARNYNTLSVRNSIHFGYIERLKRVPPNDFGRYICSTYQIYGRNSIFRIIMAWIKLVSNSLGLLELILMHLQRLCKWKQHFHFYLVTCNLT